MWRVCRFCRLRRGVFPKPAKLLRPWWLTILTRPGWEGTVLARGPASRASPGREEIKDIPPPRFPSPPSGSRLVIASLAASVSQKLPAQNEPGYRVCPPYASDLHGGAWT